MTIHHLPTNLDRKLDQLTATLDNVANKLDHLTNITHLTHDLPDSYDPDECSTCTNLIQAGNAFVDLSRKVEQHETHDGMNFVTVIDSDVLATFCAECGNRHANARTWRRKLLETLGLGEQDASGDGGETCNMCHCCLPNGSARATIELMISQVVANAASDDGGGHIPIFAEDVLVFCPACGNKMSRDRLSDAVNELLEEEREASRVLI
jgi:hypothetical protein